MIIEVTYKVRIKQEDVDLIRDTCGDEEWTDEDMREVITAELIRVGLDDLRETIRRARRFMTGPGNSKVIL